LKRLPGHLFALKFFQQGTNEIFAGDKCLQQRELGSSEKGSRGGKVSYVLAMDTYACFGIFAVGAGRPEK